MFAKSFLICFVCLSLLQIDGRNAEGITLFPMEVLQRKLGQITDRILSWSPFGSVGKNGGKQNDEIELDLNEKNSNLTIKRHYFYGCECKSYFCSCCSHIEVAKTSLNHTGCLNMTYEGAENQYRMNIKFDLNERIYYNNSISMVKQPEEMCAQYNSLNSTKLCLKFYRLDARNRSLSGSADLIVKETAADTELSRIKLGTFRFGNGTQYYEKNLMKIYLNRNKTPYDIGHMSNRSNMSSLEQFYESYDNFINKLNYFPLPKFSFNFQPDRLIDNLYNSLFSSRMIKKKSNETLPSSLSSSSSGGSSIDYVTPSMESREADFNEKRGYYRVHEQP